MSVVGGGGRDPFSTVFNHQVDSSKVHQFPFLAPFAITPPSQLPLASILRLTPLDPIQCVIAAVTAPSSSLGTRIQTLGPSAFRISIGTAVPVRPRYCCNAAVRYDRAVISSRVCRGCAGGRDWRESWKYEYGGWRRVKAIVVPSLCANFAAAIVTNSKERTSQRRPPGIKRNSQ